MSALGVWLKSKTIGVVIVIINVISLVASASVEHPKRSISSPSSSHSVENWWSFVLPVAKEVFNEEEDLTQPTLTASAEESPGNCTEPSIKDFPTDLFTVAELRKGGIIFHTVAALYIFYAIAHLCEEFFVPAVNCISTAFRIPKDVAGATFMAIATSSPEFFTNVVGTFLTEGDIGVGSVVGSVVFNLLAIIAWCGFAVKEGLQLEWWPLTRDCGFYVFSVLSLIVVLWDGRVYWYEGMLFVLAYIVYLIVICKNEKIQSWFCRDESEEQPPDLPSKPYLRKTPAVGLRDLLVKSLSYDGLRSSCEETPLLSDKNGKYMLITPESVKSHVIDEKPRRKKRHMRTVLSTPNIRVAVLSENLRNGRSSKRLSPPTPRTELIVIPTDDLTVEVTRTWLQKLERLLGWPVRLLLHITVPDCRTQRYAHWYPLTFTVCILYMAVFSYLITWMMTVIGNTLWIPDAVTGLTFIAAGTSLPEALSSIIVAQQGLGTMSISNSVGSNTFNILICLGLPWLMRTFILTAQGKATFIPMTAGGFGYVSVFLVASAVIVYGLIAWNKFVLDKKIGSIALIMYATFLTLASLLELNYFFPVNLPTCGPR